MSRIFWVHDECLHRPADLAAGDRWVYIWDADYIADQAWSLKRQVFLYETLCALAEQGCEVVGGETVTVMKNTAFQAGDWVTECAQDPVLQALMARAQCVLPRLKILFPPGLVDSSVPLPLRRFFPYWKTVEPLLLGARRTETHHRVR
ncbi:MAG: hypothetical protein ACP5D0_00905 [Hydrogenovibrio sp.]